LPVGALLMLATAATPACPLPGAALHARLAGSVAREIAWTAADFQCEGMRRADGGIRLRFTGTRQDGDWAFVFGIPDLAEGAAGRALPVNLTVIAPDGQVYGTRGAERCTLDDLQQVRLAESGEDHRWQVRARGFCLGPARAIGGDGALFVTTFEWTGLVVWEADAAPAAAVPPP
jgi:hypothetical protein